MFFLISVQHWCEKRSTIIITGQTAVILLCQCWVREQNKSFIDLVLHWWGTIYGVIFKGRSDNVLKLCFIKYLNCHTLFVISIVCLLMSIFFQLILQIITFTVKIIKFYSYNQIVAEYDKQNKCGLQEMISLLQSLMNLRFETRARARVKSLTPE